MTGLAAVVLAAGKGTRMKSKLPKVLHPIAGRPMILHCLDAVRRAGAGRTVVVVGHAADQVRQALGAVETVEQLQQLGTGHALLQTRPQLEGSARTLLVTYGDTPLLTEDTLRQLVQRHADAGATVTFLTAIVDRPDGLGRVVRDASGRVAQIVEEREAGPAELAIREVNAGIYCLRADWAWPVLERLPRHASGEVYLTDVIGAAVAAGEPIVALAADPTEVTGINNRVQLAAAEAAVRRQICERLMLDGVTIVDPGTTYVDATVSIGPDTVIYPNTTLAGRTSIGADCAIGPNSIVRDATIGDRCRVLASVVEASVIESDVDLGPFSHLRPRAHVERGAHLGNFVEVKASQVGAGTHIGHFSYVGDATIGRDVNIGAGTITCNYDGVAKHRTEVGDGAFIGSDTMLVAPVKVGARAKTGAGAVVTRDVPADATAVGVPARVRNDAARRPAPAASEE